MKMSLGLTGGIATGKSTVLTFLKEKFSGAEVFDADQVVRGFFEKREILDELSVLFGSCVLRSDGQLDREEMRSQIFSDVKQREKLESFLHPKVRKECLEKHKKWLIKSASTLFVADVPLLFEVELDFGQDMNLVVATSQSTQRSRLKKRNHFDDEMISSILAAQLPILDKVNRADVVFWNEGPKILLFRQLEHFLDSIDQP
ncbi:dephospho-CoA kinase [Akkermansiaceae bacterium]|nr:dephospho-CoA kinase [Akkermansiaceae bacterium]